MKLNVTAFALAAGLLWGAALLLVAVANLVSPGYGRAFLDVMDSVYPGYHAGAGMGSAVTGGVYGLVDGAIGGALFAWLYNLLAPPR